MRNRMMKFLHAGLTQVSVLAVFLLSGVGAGAGAAQETTAESATAPVDAVETAAVQATAVPTKIGVIDVRRLISDSNVGQQAMQEMEALKEAKTAALEAASVALEQLQTQITEGRLSLSQERLNELNRQLEDGTTAYRRSVQDAEQELQTAQARSFGTIEREIVPLIRQIGQENQFAAILSITDGGVVYSHEQVNITGLVVERYNNQKASETTAPAEG